MTSTYEPPTARPPLPASAAHQERASTVAALSELLTLHPDLAPERSGLRWTLTPAGVLHAEARDATDRGRALDRCAQIMNATPVRAHVGGPDRVVVAELAGVWHGVPVEVWETYPDDAPRRLGTVVPVTEARCG